MTVGQASRNKHGRAYMAWCGISEGDNGGYAQFTTCAHCGRVADDEGKLLYCRGFVAEAMWCFDCFLHFGEPPRKGAPKDATGARTTPAGGRPAAEVPTDYRERIVAAVADGQRFSDIEKALVADGVPVPGGRKSHYPVIQRLAKEAQGTARTGDQQQVLARIMEWRGEGKGFGKIADLLNEAGTPTFGKPGARWHAATVSKIVAGAAS